MLRKRILSWLPAWVALCALAPSAAAQDHAAPPGYNSHAYPSMGPGLGHDGFKGAGENEVYNPFIAQPQDNSVRYLDDQFFAPAELGGISKVPNAHTGWYGQYDRYFVLFSRPNASRTEFSSPRNNEELDNGFFDTDDDGEADVFLAFQPPIRGNFSRPGDFDDAWGNRWEIGYMSEEDSGWFGAVYRVEGPSIRDRERDERFTEVDFVVGDTFVFVDNAGNAIVTIELPDRADEDGVFNNTRTLNIPGQQRSISSSFWSAELNKSYRARLDNGTFFEPYFGVRYSFMRDYYTDLRDYRDLTSQFQDGFEVGIGQIIAGVFDGYYSVYTQYAKNHMIGPQLGAKWHGTSGRFDFSLDLRAVAAYNRQLFGYRYDPGIGTALLLSPVEERNAAAHEFVPIGQLKAQTSFNLTKYIQLQAGVDVMYFGRGVVRTDTEPQEFDPYPIRDQDLLLSGFTFGFAVNH